VSKPKPKPSPIVSTRRPRKEVPRPSTIRTNSVRHLGVE
jgi:hypothetical protein